MSKMDGLRAMREAKYAEAAKRAAKPAAKSDKSAGAPKKAAKPTVPAAGAETRVGPSAAEASPEQSEQLCGHRNMGGRTCTREHGHAAKSHRYS